MRRGQGKEVTTPYLSIQLHCECGHICNGCLWPPESIQSVSKTWNKKEEDNAFIHRREREVGEKPPPGTAVLSVPVVYTPQFSLSPVEPRMVFFWFPLIVAVGQGKYINEGGQAGLAEQGPDGDGEYGTGMFLVRCCAVGLWFVTCLGMGPKKSFP